MVMVHGSTAIIVLTDSDGVPPLQKYMLEDRFVDSILKYQKEDGRLYLVVFAAISVVRSS